MESLTRYLLVSAIVLFVIVFYRWLIRYLRRNDIQQVFPYIYPFQSRDFNGSEQLKIELPAHANVLAEIYHHEHGMIREVLRRDLPAGTHEFAIDTSGLAPSAYELKITLPNQTIKRPFIIS